MQRWWRSRRSPCCRAGCPTPTARVSRRWCSRSPLRSPPRASPPFVVVLARHRLLLAGLAAGLTLGIRPSYAPAFVALPLLFTGADRLRWIGGGAIGVFAWLAPLAAIAGPAQLATIATRFVAGHAGEWGGTAIVQPDLTQRLSLFGFDFAAAGLGLPWPGALDAARFAVALVLGAGLAALLVRGKRLGAVARAALLVAAPYAAWAFLGQNLIKARHVLPLLAAFALICALVPAALHDARAAYAAALACALLAVALPLAREQGAVPAPGVQLVQYVAAQSSPAGASYFTGEEARLFEQYAPQFRAGRLAGGDELASATALLAGAGVDVYVTSAAPGFERLRPQLEELARFATSPLVRAHANPIVLYRYRPAVAGGGGKLLKRFALIAALAATIAACKGPESTVPSVQFSADAPAKVTVSLNRIISGQYRTITPICVGQRYRVTLPSGDTPGTIDARAGCRCARAKPPSSATTCRMCLRT